MTRLKRERCTCTEGQRTELPVRYARVFGCKGRGPSSRRLAGGGLPEITPCGWLGAGVGGLEHTETQREFRRPDVNRTRGFQRCFTASTPSPLRTPALSISNNRGKGHSRLPDKHESVGHPRHSSGVESWGAGLGLVVGIGFRDCMHCA